MKTRRQRSYILPRIGAMVWPRFLRLSALAIALTTNVVLLVSCLPASAQRTQGAKGLFYEQLQQPAAELNTGLQYWIELRRGGETERVSNKTTFRSGDQIRFHIQSNIDAFAYIVLQKGSGGEESVLFPDPSYNDDVKIKRGRDYALPGDSFLLFDSHPGVEKVLLLISRSPLDPKLYLKDGGNAQVHLAAAESSTKDLIPAQTSVSDDLNGSKTISVTPANSGPATIPKDVVGPGQVTIVHRDPSAVLAVDLALRHDN